MQRSITSRPDALQGGPMQPAFKAMQPPRDQAGGALLGGALGALGGTLGCLLLLAAIGALGLFSCIVAITAYAKQFLDNYKTVEGLNGAGQTQIAFMLLFASLVYTIICRIQRS